MVRQIIVVVVLATGLGCSSKPETDPVFVSSPADSISQAEINDWNSAYGGADAGADAGITALEILHWNTAYGWGNHAVAGYLKSESDPVFLASAAAAIGAGNVAQWNSAYSRVAPTDAGAVPRWNGTALVDGSLFDDGLGHVSVVGALPNAALASAGGSFTKSCPVQATAGDYSDTPESDGPCAQFCADAGLVDERVLPSGSSSCDSAVCDFITDFSTCAIGNRANLSNCSSCATTFTCSCVTNAAKFSGVVSVTGGDLGVQNGYLQLDSTAGSPPVADCAYGFQHGRMKIDPSAGLLWICTNTGWISK